MYNVKQIIGRTKRTKIVPTDPSYVLIIKFYKITEDVLSQKFTFLVILAQCNFTTIYFI